MKKFAICILLLTSASFAQQMDEKNDPAQQFTFYMPHRLGVAKERQTDSVLRDVWTIAPFIAAKYDHSEKWMGMVIRLHGNKHVLSTGAGGLMFTVDGKRLGLAPEILAHSRRETSCALTRCNVTWTIEPKTQIEAKAFGEFVKSVADAHEVYATLFPGDSGGGERFTATLTDEQLKAFQDTQQYFDSLAPKN
jgi:hypothetical protein